MSEFRRGGPRFDPASCQILYGIFCMKILYGFFRFFFLHFISIFFSILHTYYYENIADGKILGKQIDYDEFSTFQRFPYFSSAVDISRLRSIWNMKLFIWYCKSDMIMCVIFTIFHITTQNLYKTTIW